MADTRVSRGRRPPSENGPRGGAQRAAERTEVKIVASAECPRLAHDARLRLGEGAELEIRRMAVRLPRLLQQEAPALFGDFSIYTTEDGSEAGRSGVS